MKIQVLQGGNFKNYLHFYDITTPKDLAILNDVKKIVSRSEYKPYIKAFNKNISESFLLPNNLVPAQFIQDIQTKLFPLHGDIPITNLHYLYDYNWDEEFFQTWLDNIILPEDFTVESDEYIYQKHALRNLLISKTGRIKIGTGGGKTLITYLYIKFLLDNVLRKLPEDSPNKILLVIDRKDLIIQTTAEFEKFDEPNLLNNNDYCIPLRISSIYSGSKKLANANVVIATWQSIVDYEPEWFNEYKVFMLDEAHKGKAYSIRKAIYNNLRNIEYCAGFTATWPDYNTLDYLTLIAMFGPLVLVKTTRQLIDDGNVCDVLIVRIMITYHESERNFRKQLKEDNPDLRGSELYLLEKAWFHNHHGRNMICVSLIKALPNNHLILVDTVAYIHLLAELINEHCPDREVLIIWSDVSTEVRQSNKYKMQNEHGKIMIATKETMSTGVSINNIWYVHNIDGGKSPITTSQGLGRSLRKFEGKDKAHYFDYVDDIPTSSFKKHAAERLKIFKNEQLEVTEIYKTVEPNNYGY